jgi:Dolichyl-phosphate-mannose-protein mannosyltransferase
MAPSYTPARPSGLRTRNRVRPGEPFPLKRRGRARLPVRRQLGLSTTAAFVAVATLAGAVIRLAVTRGLSLDEVHTADLTHLSFGGLITHLAHAGVQPPLHPVLVWLAARVFGGDDYVLRLPSLAAGVALIPVIAWLAGELFDRRTAIAVALFAAVAPALVWYSQDVSRYALVALFGTLAAVGAARAVQHGRTGDWVLHAVAASLTMWAGWSGIFVVMAIELGLTAAAIARHHAGAPLRPFLVAWGVDTLALAFQVAALAVLFASQLQHNGGLTGVAGVSASGVSFYTTVSNVSWGLFGFHPSTVTAILSALWPLAMLASLVMIGREGGARRWLLLVCALVPAIAVFVLGLAVPSAFDVRYALAAVPLVLVLVAHVATAWPRSRLGRNLVVGGIVLLLAGALVDQQLDPNNPRRYEYRRALAAPERDARSGAAVFYLPAAIQPVIRRYAPGLHASALGRTLPTRAEAPGVVVISSFANDPAALAVRNRELGALRATRHLVSYRRYPGVDVWWFR